MMKVIILGIDGLSPDTLVKFANYLDLPNLKEVIRKGIVTSIETVYPPSSAPAWTSLFTGLSPENHGVFDFFDTALLRKGIITIDKTLYSKTLWKKTIWTKLSQREKRVLCVGVPVFYPARKLNGVYIAGELLTPKIDKNAVFPQNIYKLIEDYNYNKIFDEMHDAVARIATVRLFGSYEDISFLINDIVKNEVIKFDIFRTLAEKDNYDLFIFVTTAYDYLSHYFLDEHNIKRTIKILKPYFIKLEYFIKHILSMIDDDSILFIVSDHGMHTINKVFLINNWLKLKGLISLKDYHIKYPKIINIQKSMISLLIKMSKFFSLNKKLKSYLELKIKNITKARSIIDFIDINKSLGYCLSYSSFGIFLKNSVLKQQLVNELLHLKDKSGINIFEGAYSYNSNKAPDIILMPAKGYTISPIITKSKNIIVKSNMVGAKIADHSKDATFIVYPKERYHLHIPRNIMDISKILLQIINKEGK